MNVTESVRTHSRKMVRELGLLNANPCLPSLSLTDGHILIELSSKPKQPIKELSATLMLDHSTMSRAISKLVANGLLSLQEGKKDKRERVVSLTAKGEKSLAKLHHLSDQLVTQAFAHLDPKQQETVVQGLSLYASALAKARVLSEFTIRPVQQRDNASIASVIRSVMSEYGATKPGFAIHDPEVDAMFETYQKTRSFLLVVEYQGEVVGCGGVAPLKGEEKNVCEIQKMYFLKEARGKGLGEKLLKELLLKAKAMGFSRSYLETTAQMKEAHRLYEKVGFKKRKSSLGCTGHFACEVWYDRDL